MAETVWVILREGVSSTRAVKAVHGDEASARDDLAARGVGYVMEKWAVTHSLKEEA